MHVVMLQEWRGPPLTCEVCGKNFTGRNRRQNLQQHQMIHTGIKPFSCPYCSHSSNRKGNMDMHILRVHGEVLRDTNESPSLQLPPGDVGSHGDVILCPVCGKGFQGRSRRWKLDRHMLLHTGEKPYQCPYCSHRANQKNNLRMHIRARHEEWPSPPGISSTGMP
nr:zinc finger protein 710-like [Penaeus vannamei]